METTRDKLLTDLWKLFFHWSSFLKNEIPAATTKADKNKNNAGKTKCASESAMPARYSDAQTKAFFESVTREMHSINNKKKMSEGGINQNLYIHSFIIR